MKHGGTIPVTPSPHFEQRIAVSNFVINCNYLFVIIYNYFVNLLLLLLLLLLLIV